MMNHTYLTRRPSQSPSTTVTARQKQKMYSARCRGPDGTPLLRHTAGCADIAEYNAEHSKNQRRGGVRARPFVHLEKSFQSNGWRTKIIASRCGPVEIRSMGTPAAASMRRRYARALAGRSSQARIPAVLVFHPG